MRRAGVLLSMGIAAVIPGLCGPAQAIDFESRPVETRELLIPYIPFLNPVPERAELLGIGHERVGGAESGDRGFRDTKARGIGGACE